MKHRKQFEKETGWKYNAESKDAEWFSFNGQRKYGGSYYKAYSQWLEKKLEASEGLLKKLENHFCGYCQKETLEGKRCDKLCDKEQCGY